MAIFGVFLVEDLNSTWKLLFEILYSLKLESTIQQLIKGWRTQIENNLIEHSSTVHNFVWRRLNYNFHGKPVPIKFHRYIQWKSQIINISCRHYLRILYRQSIINISRLDGWDAPEFRREWWGDRVRVIEPAKNKKWNKYEILHYWPRYSRLSRRFHANKIVAKIRRHCR